jgi:endonuclease/exonuclease/phosphatase family metal-dependent hydrolase
VYGHVKFELKGQFLWELFRKIKSTDIPLVVVGDFNMIRFVHEKSNGSEYIIWMDMFNSFINDTALIEIIRGGSRFTWTNKQANPIKCVLDRVFVSKDWEHKLPKARTQVAKS